MNVHYAPLRGKRGRADVCARPDDPNDPRERPSTPAPANDPVEVFIERHTAQHAAMLREALRGLLPPPAPVRRRGTYSPPAAGEELPVDDVTRAAARKLIEAHKLRGRGR